MIHLLGEFVALLAHAPDTDSAALEALRRLRLALHADQVEIQTDDGSWTKRSWDEADSGIWAAVGGHAEMALPLRFNGRSLGMLRVVRSDALRDDEHVLAAAVADLMALVLALDSRARELEGQVSASVREIAAQRAFIECVVDSLPFGLYVVDRDYRIHAWNHKRETGLQGVARTDAIGRTIFEVLPRQPAGLLRREFDDVFASGQLQQFQMESQAFGGVRTFRISKIPMRMDGETVSHVITVGEDITDWRSAIDRMAQSEKLAALGQLAAGVMHEINNPLATIAACAESMQLQRATRRVLNGDEEPAMVASADELLRIIDLEVQRCKRITDGLLDFSRPKPAQREAIELNGVVEQGMFLLQHHPKYKRVKMVVDLAHASTMWVDGDADQLVQVFIALAINAIDATPDGGRVTVSTRVEQGDDGETMTLQVSDEGPGIPRALQAKIFEPFFTTKAPGQGTGLGLAICYGIINDHGGHLDLVNPDGRGATFRVTLPSIRFQPRPAA